MSINVTPVSSTTQVTSSDARYLGASIRDATGDGNVIIYKGTTTAAANGIDVLGASDEKQADHHYFGPPGIRCPGGIRVRKTNCDQVYIYWKAE